MDVGWQGDIRRLVERPITRGSAYGVEAMADMVDAAQHILCLGADGTVRRVGLAETLATFRTPGEARAAPLATEAGFLHIEERADRAVVLLRRLMQLIEPSRPNELRLRKVGGLRKVSGETVTPWPGASSNER